MVKVYILYSRSLNRYYIGHSSNLEDRLERHNRGRSKYTKGGEPWKLTWVFDCKTRSDAMKLERKIKKRGAKRFLEDQLGV